MIAGHWICPTKFLRIRTQICYSLLIPLEISIRLWPPLTIYRWRTPFFNQSWTRWTWTRRFSGRPSIGSMSAFSGPHFMIWDRLYFSDTPLMNATELPSTNNIFVNTILFNEYLNFLQDSILPRLDSSLVFSPTTNEIPAGPVNSMFSRSYQCLKRQRKHPFAIVISV